MGHRTSLHGKRRIDIVLEESEVIDHINGKVSYEYMERDQKAQGILMKSVKGPFIPYIAELET